MVDNNMPILENLSQITGVKVGVSVSQHQTSPIPNSNHGELLRRGTSGTFRQIWENRPRFDVKAGEMPQETIESFKASILAHGGRLLERVKQHMVNAGSESAGIYFDLDGDVLEVASNKNNVVGVAYVGALIELAGKCQESGLKPHFVVNQYAGLQKEKLSKKEGKNRMASLRGKLGDSLSLSHLPDHDIELRDYATNVGERLGGKTMRISIEPALLYPNPDQKMDRNEFNRIRDWILHCRSIGIEPNICVSHFTRPAWMGYGWEDSRIVDFMANMTHEIFEGLNEADAMPAYVTTVNEPITEIAAANVSGEWPGFQVTHPLEIALLNIEKPGPMHSKGAKDYAASIKNVIAAHMAMYDVVKGFDKNIPVGLTHNMPAFFAIDKHPLNPLAVKLLEQENQKFLKLLFRDALSKLDFVGLQFYNAFPISGLSQDGFGTHSFENHIETDYEMFPNNWLRYPEGIIIQMMQLSDLMLAESVRQGGARMPDMHISETGVPSYVDPGPELVRIAEAIAYAKKIITANVDQISIWTGDGDMHGDPWEWGTAFSAFGFTDRDGNPKPKGSRIPQELNLRDGYLVANMQNHLRVLRKVKIQIEKQIKKGDREALKDMLQNINKVLFGINI